MSDPFADAPADEAQVAPAQTNSGPWEEKKAAPVVVGSDGKVVVTLKGGGGYDAPWIVIHASDVDDALKNLSDEKLRDLMDRTKRAGAYFSGGSAPKAQGGNNQRSSQPGKPAGADEGPLGPQYCDHGEQMKFLSGVGKNGRAYAFYACAKPRNEQCAKKINP